jgi:hypothetical protein
VVAGRRYALYSFLINQSDINHWKVSQPQGTTITTFGGFTPNSVPTQTQNPSTVAPEGQGPSASIPPTAQTTIQPTPVPLSADSPGFDKACDLLRHVVTQNPADPWLQSTRFIVDAWHYIGHRATDAICRLWCNPSPSDGSQPDLVVTQTDDDGNVHTTRAFNTETAEQFNSWLEGFEAQVRQMTDVTYDFYIHVLMMVYKDMVDEKIERLELSLDEEFWDRVEGLGDGSA